MIDIRKFIEDSVNVRIRRMGYPEVEDVAEEKC
jgi:hypothetical protein